MPKVDPNPVTGAQAPVNLIRLARVSELTRMSKSGVYAALANGFPRPVKVGKRSCWIESEIFDFLRACVNARDGRAA